MSDGESVPSAADGEVLNMNEDEFIPSNFSIAIHTILNEAQQSHGVPHKDYTQYRTYLTSRLARIRHAKPVIKSLSHGPKRAKPAGAGGAGASTGASGSGTGASKKKGAKHAFQHRETITPQQANQHVNFILDGLYSTERAWAHAMELKAVYEEVVSVSVDESNTKSSFALTKKKTSPGKVRQHYLNRLKKAVNHVQKLEDIVQAVCDGNTNSEMKCYAAWIKGNYYCEISDWKNACQQYALALQLCNHISKSISKSASTMSLSLQEETTTTTTEAESLQLSDFFHSRAVNIVQPLLRYSKYELEQEGNYTRDEITSLCHVGESNDDQENEDEEDNELIQQKLNSNKFDNDSQLSSIIFRGHHVSIDESNIRKLFFNINTAKEELEHMSKPSSKNNKKKKVKASVKETKFMELLNLYDEVTSIVTKMLKDYEGMVSGPTVNQKRFECSLLLGYCKYEKLKMLMKRNEQMVHTLRESDREILNTMSGGVGSGSSASPKMEQEDADAKYKRVEEIAHLYDALLQDAKTVAHLPGGGDGVTGIGVDADDGQMEDEFVMEANANVLRIRALRCYYIGRMYAADTVAKYKEALALLEQSAVLASEAAEEIAACQDMEMGDELIESMADLKKEVIAAQCRTRASSYLASRGSGASSATTGLTLLRRLDDFDSGGKTYRIAAVPPNLEPMPCKPAFFDIANSYVNQFPIDELEFYANTLKATGSRGFMSWFRKS